MTIASSAMTADVLPLDSPLLNETPLNGWQPNPGSFAVSNDAGEPLPASPWNGRLAIDPTVSESSPVVIGTFVTTRHIASLVVDGWSWAEIRRAHPGIVDDDIRACLAYAIEEESPTFG